MNVPDTMTMLDAPVEPAAGDRFVLPTPEPQPPVAPEAPGDTRSRLDVLSREKNIAKRLKDDVLAAMATRVVEEYKIDNDSRADWMKQYDKALEFASLVSKGKSFPWPNSSDVKYPLIAQAAIQFAARAYPTVVNGVNVVKGRVIGRDPDGEKAARAQRVGDHMSWQLTEEMEEWEDDMDWLLTVLPVTGCEFKKTWYDPGKGQNVSEWVSARDVVVNNGAKSLEGAGRITHVYVLYPYEIRERVMSGRFLDIEYGRAQGTANDQDTPHTFYEQHRRWDVDKDGYEEPYIVTVHKETGKVARVTAGFDSDGVYLDADTGDLVAITPTQYFTKYSFLRSFDGTFYDVGFGLLLNHSNEIIDTAINQLFDAGTNQNAGGGWISGGLVAGRTGGQVAFKPGEYKVVSGSMDDLRKGIVDRPTPQPSQTMFQLLQLLITASENLSSPRILMGDLPPANTPATTTLAMVEQGLKVFGSIYKRVYRALRKEYKKLFRLNRLYLGDEEYFVVSDDERSVARDDYNEDDCNVVPVSDPEGIADTMKVVQAEALLKMMGTGLNDKAIQRRYLESIHTQDVDEIMTPDEDAPQGPPPEIQLKMAELELEKERLALDAERFRAEADKTKAEIERLNADTQRLLAEADKIAADTGNVGVSAETEVLRKRVRDLEAKLYNQQRQQGEGAASVPEGSDEGGLPGMESQLGDGGVLQGGGGVGNSEAVAGGNGGNP